MLFFFNRTKNSYLHHKGDISMSSASFGADENGAAVSYTHAGIRWKIKVNDSIYSVSFAQDKTDSMITFSVKYVVNSVITF